MPLFDCQGAELDGMESSTSEAPHQFSLINNQSAKNIWFDIDYVPDDIFPQPPEGADPPPVLQYRGYSFEFLYDFTERDSSSRLSAQPWSEGNRSWQLSTTLTSAT